MKDHFASGRKALPGNENDETLHFFRQALRHNGCNLLNTYYVPIIWEGNGNPHQYSWENSMDRGAWWATVHGVTKSQTPLSDWTHTHTAHPLQKEWIICGFLHVAHGSLPLFVCTCCFLCAQFSSSFLNLADNFYSFMIHFRQHILLEASPGPIGWVKSLPLFAHCMLCIAPS